MSMFRCPECGYTYDEAQGNPREGFAPGTAWSELPADYYCPDCGVEHRDDFEEVAEPKGV